MLYVAWYTAPWRADTTSTKHSNAASSQRDSAHQPTEANQIDYSTNGGRTWMSRYSGSSCGEFIDLVHYNNELIAITTKGIYYSTNSGRTWMSRYTGTSCGKFLSLMNNGKELLAQTEKGLYYSTNSGRTWMRR